MAEVCAVQRAFTAQGILDVYAGEHDYLGCSVWGGYGGSAEQQLESWNAGVSGMRRVWPGSADSVPFGERAAAARHEQERLVAAAVPDPAGWAGDPGLLLH